MKKFLLAALTSLFVGAMPLSAAYSQDAPEECSIAPLSIVINDEVKSKIEAEGGQLLKFDTPETLVPILNAMTEDMGSPPPFDFDAIYISHPSPDAPNTNILFSKGNCAVNFLRRSFRAYTTLFEKT